MINNPQKYTVFATFSVEEVMPLLSVASLGRHRFCKDGQEWNVNLSSTRFIAFANSLRCVCCGIKGSIFKLESNNDSKPHLNLYAVLPDGEEILMTRDHIFPCCKGGKDCASNVQTMCQLCNFLKCRDEITLEDLRERRVIADRKTINDLLYKIQKQRDNLKRLAKQLGEIGKSNKERKHEHASD